jgi:hypothetical protein
LAASQEGLSPMSEYLTLSIAQLIQHQMIRPFMNNEFKRRQWLNLGTIPELGRRD